MIDSIITNNYDVNLADLPILESDLQQAVIDDLNILNSLSKNKKIECDKLDLTLYYTKDNSEIIEYKVKIRKNLIKRETIKINKKHVIKRKDMFIDNKTSMLCKINNIQNINMLSMSLNNLFYLPTEKFITSYFTLEKDNLDRDLTFFNLSKDINSIEKYRELNINKQTIINCLAAKDRYCTYILRNIPKKIQIAILSYNLKFNAKPQIIFI